jgi:hypothetical protein
MMPVCVEEWWASFHLGLLSDLDDDSNRNTVITLSLSLVVGWLIDCENKTKIQ